MRLRENQAVGHGEQVDEAAVRRITEIFSIGHAISITFSFVPFVNSLLSHALRHGVERVRMIGNGNPGSRGDAAEAPANKAEIPHSQVVRPRY